LHSNSQYEIAVEEGFTNEITEAQRPTRAMKKLSKQSTQRRALSFQTEERNLYYIVGSANISTWMLSAVRRKILHSHTNANPVTAKEKPNVTEDRPQPPVVSGGL
jgi:hypothetical protein